MIALLAFVACALGPGPLAGHSMVYSTREKAVLMFGGDAAGSAPIYRLGPKGWTAVPGSDFPVHSLAAVATDDEGNILLHGGSTAVPKSGGGADYKLSAETWLWNGKTWRKLAATGPAPRDHHTMAYDSARKTFVLFGGSDADPTGRAVFYGDTWEWSGTSWKQIATDGPGLRCHHAMAYDPIHKQTIVIGGYGPKGGNDQVWAWNGLAWKSIGPADVAGRGSPRLCWDPVGRRLLAFGGDKGETSPSDTWAWDGSTWSQVAKSGPPGRSVHAMAFDASRGVVVVYGGSSGNDVLDDTWEFAKGTWTKRN